MSVKDIGTMLKSQEYDFLRENENLGSNIILLGFGGSHAYGTNNENSDVDIRGIATRTKREILTGGDFEQVVDVDYKIVGEYEKKLDYLKDHTSIPDEVDMKKVNDLLAEINGMVVSQS